MAEDTKTYLPKQHVRRGKAGYFGKDIVVVDATGRQRSAAQDAAEDQAAIVSTSAARKTTKTTATKAEADGA